MHFLLMDLNPPFNLIIDHQLDLGLNVLIQFVMRLILTHRLSIQVVFVLLDFCAQHIEIRVVFVRINLELLPLHTQLNLLPLGQPRHLRITQIPGLVSRGTLTPRILQVHRHNSLIGLAHGRPQGLLEEV